MRNGPSALILSVLLAANAFCAEILPANISSAVFHDTLITPGEDGYRTGGIIPFRKDSPALHYEPAEQGVEIIPLGEFNSTAMGGFSYLRKSLQPIPDGPHALVRGGYGAFGTAHTSLLTSYGTNRVSLMGGYGYRRAEVAETGGGGLKGDVYPATNLARYRSDVKDGLAYESQAGYLRLDAAPFVPLMLSISWLRTEAENIRYPMLKLDSGYDTNNDIEAVFRFKKPMTGVRDITVAGFWRAYDALFDDRLRESARLSNGALRPYSMQNWGELSKYGVRSSATIPQAGGEMIIGGDYGIMNVDAVNRTNSGTAVLERSLIPDVAITFGGGYLGWGSNPAKPFRVSTGLRLDVVSAEAQKAPAAAKFEAAEPSGWLKGSWRAGDGLDISLAFGSTVKFPNAQELFIGITNSSSQLGVPGLAPARAYRPELSIDYHGTSLELHSYAYWSRIDDYVALYQMNQATRSFRNVEAELWGAGVFAVFKLPDNLGLKLVLDYSQGDDITRGNPLPEIFPLTGNVSIRYDDRRLFCSVTERFSSRQWRTDSTLGELPNPSWAVTDVMAGYRYKSVKFSAGVDNLADTRYSTHLMHLRDPLVTGVRIPEAGRFAWGMVEIAL